MTGCHSCVFSDLDCRIASPTPGRFGCSGRNSPRPAPSGHCSRASMQRFGNASAIRFHRHGGPDRRCAPDRRSASAQHPGREEGDQGRPHPRRLERQAREAPPEGSRRALDSQIHPNTPRPSRASKPREDGSTPPVDLAIPVFGYQNHISLDRGFGFIRKGSATDAAAYEGRRLRDGLLDKTNTARSVWADTAYRSAANEEFMERNGFVSHVHRKRPKGRPMRSDPARQHRQIENPFARRACLCRAEGSDGFVHPDRRDRESEDEDRPGEPRLQYQTPALPAAHRGGMIDNCLRQGALTSPTPRRPFTSDKIRRGSQSNPLNHAAWSR